MRQTKAKSVHKNLNWTATDRARHQAVRQRFRDWHPTHEELLATGEYDGPLPLGLVVQTRVLLAELRKARRAAGLTLADVARKSGIDRTAVSRLENGRQPNLTLRTLARYADAVGRMITISALPVDGKRQSRKRQPGSNPAKSTF